ncbi:MAG: DNA/RNA nuclease SfsA [Firmicutes bacterium]|nr:DNA/RNA nuclease SfsA [Bacillota bacterium]
MKYQNIVKAKFIERENRFVATALVNVDSAGNFCGVPVKVHVKNTGRCKELLIPGVTVYLEDFEGRMGNRKMRYSLIAVEKQIETADEQGNAKTETLLINMDSQAPNKVVQEALLSGKLRLAGLEQGLAGQRPAGQRPVTGSAEEAIREPVVKPEYTYGNSRFDFYVELPAGDSKTNAAHTKAFIEVKGVTLENNGFARFPDAPTERGLKHIEELIKAVDDGYDAYIIFVIQMKKIHTFGPNYETHPALGKALQKAAKKGVQILAYDCEVGTDSLTLDTQVPIDLSRPSSVY